MTYSYSNMEIQIYYSSSESIPTYGTMYAPNQMRIEYMDKDLIDRERLKFQSDKKQQDLNNQRIRDSLEKANKKDALNRI